MYSVKTKPKRNRNAAKPQTTIELGERIAILHPTKGWRNRNYLNILNFDRFQAYIKHLFMA